MPGVVLVNPHSGPEACDLDHLRRLFAGHRVEECEPDDLADAVAAAVADRADFVGVAGGDGTIRTAATVLAGTSVPLLPIPGGTRNHFARTMGIEDVDGAARASAGVTTDVDLGEVNGEYFVNNSTLGLYPKLVARRERYEHKIGKQRANVIAAWQQWRSGSTIDIEVDGSPFTAWLVFVGNGTYGDGLLDLGARTSLSDHTLDLRIARADARLSRLRVIGAVLLGRLDRSPLVIRRQASALSLGCRASEVDVANDGEVIRLQSPLRYRSRAGALQVLVPTEQAQPDDATQRAASAVTTRSDSPSPAG